MTEDADTSFTIRRRKAFSFPIKTATAELEQLVNKHSLAASRHIILRVGFRPMCTACKAKLRLTLSIPCQAHSRGTSSQLETMWTRPSQ